MEKLLDEETTERLRAALEAMRRGFAEVEEIVYREKCATLPHLSIEERLATFAHLYQLAKTFRSPDTSASALDTLRIAETVALRQLFIRAAGRRPPG
jgi:hypothetical protein